jgi:regulatory protein
MQKSQQQQPESTPEVDAESAVRNLVLRRLTQRAYTRHQLEDYLGRKNADPETVAKVLDRFAEVGLIDDAEYAAEFVRARRAVKGTGPAVLRMELKKRGIAEDLILQALDDRVGEDIDVARELAARKLQSLSRFDSATQNRRLVSFLVRRGYSPGLAFGLVRELLADVETDF